MTLESYMTPTWQTEIQDLIDRGALFVCNHSGGKDSQAMFLTLKHLVPAEQMVVIHAHLPGVEWDGVIEHIYRTVGDHCPVHVVQAQKTFVDMVNHRGMFPSPSYRQCTSDLKRDPINKLIRQLAKERGNGLVVSCMGLRAEESAQRAKKQTLTLDKRMSKAGREVYTWLPIHSALVGEVFGMIREHGEEAHWAYAKGMTRLSCCFCIMASKADLTCAAKLNPAMYAEFVALEEKHGFTLQNGKTLVETTGIDPRGQEDDPLEIPAFLRRAA